MKKIFLITFFAFFLLLVGSLLFSWYQIRPAQIKHECSWVKMHSDAIPAKVGLTEGELKIKGLIIACVPEPTRTPGIIPTFGLSGLSDHYSPWCDINNREVIDKYKPQKFVPARDWYKPATKEEYNFCLHDHGL